MGKISSNSDVLFVEKMFVLRVKSMMGTIWQINKEEFAAIPRKTASLMRMMGAKAVKLYELNARRVNMTCSTDR
jgi:hypothetical protein